MKITVQEVEDEEDESSWIPMVHEEDHNPTAPVECEPTTAPSLTGNTPRVAYSIPSKGTNRDDKAHSSNPDPKKPSRSERIPKEKANGDNRGSFRRSPDLQTIQNRLEDRIAMQTHLVDRPLDYFWQRCLINFIRQIWALEFRIQLAIPMLATGMSLKLMLWSTWCLFHPRVAILSVIFLGSLLYLDPFDMNNQIKGTWKTIEVLLNPSSSRQLQAGEGIDTEKIRSLSFILLMIPTMLEIRTFSFLSRINAELTANGEDNGWTTASMYCYNVGIAVCLSSVMVFLRRARGMRPCDISHRGLLILYGFSLLTAIISYESYKSNIREMAVLAAPFLTATATLLLVYEDDSYEWLSRITRQTFRLSLRDVFSLVSERVTEDDMLQLAILRWICDFWASSPESTMPETKTGAENSVPTADSRPSFQSQSTTEQQQHPISETKQPAENSSEEVSFKHNNIQWQELQAMLNIEIDHMETEIDALRTETTNCSPGNEINHSAQNHESDDSLMGLKSMLLSFDVDERAQPAVSAFRKAVESFPPKKKTAVAISILRRCPALLTTMLHALFLNDMNSLFVTGLILCPFIVIEYYRIAEWMETCQQIESVSINETEEEQRQNDWGVPSSLNNVDTMTILLSGDGHAAFRPPSLLIVWFNVVSSVSALEVGLSAARCVETTAVAIEFAGNAMSLVKFGFEISEKGIFHGVTVLLQEVISIYGNGKDIANLDKSDDSSAQYMSAAVRSVRYGQKIAKNIHTISNDKSVMSFAQPFLNFFAMLTHFGGKEEEQDNVFPTSHSTDHPEDLDGVELQGEKNEHFEIPTDSSVIGDCKSDAPSEREIISGNPEALNSEIPAQRDFIPKSATPDEDLSQIMDMIAASYEQGLIDQNEKDDFFKKLSELQAEELHDPSVLNAMKRTLTIILENGSMVSIIDDEASSSAVHKQSDGNEGNICSKSENDLSLDQQIEKSQVPQSIEKNDIISLGVAALGIAATGISMAIMNDSRKKDRSQNSFVTGENTNASIRNEEERHREAPPAVENAELAHHDEEDDWVALGD